MDRIEADDLEIAQDFRKQLQERFPPFPGDRNRTTYVQDIRENVTKLQSSVVKLGVASGEDLLQALMKELEGTPLPNPRDEPLTYSIVRTICEEIETVCRDRGIPLRGGVAYGVSPTLDITAELHSVPTTETSVISLSAGFINFCSHLSKAMALSLPHDEIEGTVRVDFDPKTVVQKIESNIELKRGWLELFGAYAYGNGPLNIEWRIVPYPQSVTRVLLLSAFERFAVAHEYGHHIEQDGKLESVGVDGDPESQDQEIKADLIAILLCRHMEMQKEQPNYFLVSGAAPVLLLKALDYVRRTRKILSSGVVVSEQPSSSTHPETNDRVLAFDSYDEFFPTKQALAFQETRKYFCSVADVIWDRLTPLFVRMHESGLRVEEGPASWLPGAGTPR